MAYELWESRTGNIIADFRTLEEALEAVRAELFGGSKSDVTTWLLMYEDEEGESDKIAAGSDLILMAQAAHA